MFKQCVRCRYFHRKAVDIPEGQKSEEKDWVCGKGHQIENPYARNDCKDFEEKSPKNP